MGWVVFVAGAVLSWGIYGAMLYQGGVALGNPLKALLCVGVAYFLVGVIVPVATLSAQGDLSGFNATGIRLATIADSGEVGAACIIWAFRVAACRCVMPLVFGGAPIISVLYSCWFPSKVAPGPMLSGVLARRSVPGWCSRNRPTA